MVKRFISMINLYFFEKNTYSIIIFIKKSYFALNFVNFHSRIPLWIMKAGRFGNRLP
jgi:hypothetical protein